MSKIGKHQYIYAIRNKKTGELINRKCQSTNPFYTKAGLAKRKIYDDSDEVVMFKLTEEKVFSKRSLDLA